MAENDLELFTRQIPVYGEAGQNKLSEATVLVIGCGGLGSTAATILSRSGVGKLILVDNDTVTASNIHRQFLYTPKDVASNKSETAAVSPLLCLSQNAPIVTRVDEQIAVSLVRQHKPNVVMDCTDNFEVRFALNKACSATQTPMVFGAITGGEGQLSVVCHTSADPMCPCLACLHPKGVPTRPPPPVIPAICGCIGSMQAQQALSIITGVGKVLVGELMTIDILKGRMRTFKVRERVHDCAVCGSGSFQ